MTYAELEELIVLIGRYIVRALAIFGLVSAVALASYLYHRDQPPVKVARADRCINSACEPGQKCSVRFQRHMGECK